MAILACSIKRKINDHRPGLRGRGLESGLVKMFCDPLHQTTPGGMYDHETTTANMREFVREGLAKTRQRGADLSMITTL